MDVEKSDDATVSAESASVSPTQELSGGESETDKFEDTATETGFCLFLFFSLSVFACLSFPGSICPHVLPFFCASFARLRRP
jgi:hypothetical protein